MVALAISILFFPSLLAVLTRIGETMADARSFDYEETKQLLHKYVNEERTKNGMDSLEYDNALASVAQGHSEDMAANHFFAHDNLNGQSPSDRAEQAGYSCYKDHGDYYTIGIAENLYQRSSDSIVLSEEEIAKASVKGWMESPGHRANILEPNYGREGFGIAEDSAERGLLYITENFC